MGRKRIYSPEERQERVNQQRKEYYERNRERISQRNRLTRLKKLGIIPEETVEKPLRKVIEQWNKQLSQHIKENLPQWLEMALKLQININTEFINLYEQEKHRL
jgi:hypothetical protein